MPPTTGVQAQKTVEQRILDKLDAMDDKVDTVVIGMVQLFGATDTDHEKQTGRLPKVESSAKKAHERMDRVERRMIYWTGAVAAVGFVLPLALLLWTAWGGKH